MDFTEFLTQLKAILETADPDPESTDKNINDPDEAFKAYMTDSGFTRKEK